MLNSFLTIGEQIFIVFLLMAVGYIGGKTGLITNAMADGMSLLVMNIAIPASIIMAFQREFESRLVHEFLLSMCWHCWAMCFFSRWHFSPYGIRIGSGGTR